MLLTRVITALVLLPLVVAGILFLPTAAVTLVVGGFFLLGAWEWGLLMHFRAAPPRLVYAVTVGVLLAALLWLPSAAGVARAVFWASVVWWLIAVFWIVRFPRGWEATLGRWPLAAVLGAVVLAGAALAVARTHGADNGAALLLLLFVMIWAADTGAYFAGRLWGRHKLAPRVSPGKTWEGAVGGLALAVAAALLGGWWPGLAAAPWPAWVALGAAMAAVSIVGDLTISMLKRSAGIKDAGNVFPGHGGVLDRLDSLLAAAPIYAVGLTMLPA